MERLIHVWVVDRLEFYKVSVTYELISLKIFYGILPHKIPTLLEFPKYLLTPGCSAEGKAWKAENMYSIAIKDIPKNLSKSRSEN